MTFFDTEVKTLLDRIVKHPTMAQKNASALKLYGRGAWVFNGKTKRDVLDTDVDDWFYVPLQSITKCFVTDTSVIHALYAYDTDTDLVFFVQYVLDLSVAENQVSAKIAFGTQTYRLIPVYLTNGAA